MTFRKPGRTGTVELPLCGRHRFGYRHQRKAALLPLAAFVGTLILGIALEFPPAIVFSFLALLLGLIAAGLMALPIKGAVVTESFVVVEGVHQNFIVMTDVAHQRGPGGPVPPTSPAGRAVPPPPPTRR
jgi:hypothetical protein